MKLAAIILFLLFHVFASAQNRNSLEKYFDTSQYYVVDSIFLDGHKDYLYVLFDYMDESVIIHKSIDSIQVYKGFLTCYLCKGRGTGGPTYSGHTKKGMSVVFLQDYFDGRDSVTVDFSDSIPSVKKIIRSSYFNEKAEGPDDIGNYLFTAKKFAPINMFNLPLDRSDPLVLQYFNIRRVKWRKL